MRLPDKPNTYVENADGIHGVRNSLGNSFADPSLISLREDLFQSRNNSNSKLPSLTLPKEVQFGMMQLEEYHCSRMQTHDNPLQPMESGKEFSTLLSNKGLCSTGKDFRKGGMDKTVRLNLRKEKEADTNVVNVKNAANRAKREMTSKEKKVFDCSLVLHEKKEFENWKKKELMQENLMKLERKGQTTDRKDAENLLKRKNPSKKNVKEETPLKQVDIEFVETKEEKGVPDALSMEKNLVSSKVEENLIENDDCFQYSGTNGKEVSMSKESAQEIEERGSLYEKWELEGEEKAKISEAMAPNDEENTQALHCRNTGRVVSEDTFEAKNCCKNDKVATLTNVVKTHCTAVEKNVLQFERIGPTTNGREFNVMVRHLWLQIMDDKCVVAVPEVENDKGALCPSSGRSEEILGPVGVPGGNSIAVKSFPFHSWISVSNFPAEPMHRKAIVTHGDDRCHNDCDSSSSFGRCQGSQDGWGFGYDTNGGGGGTVGGSGGGGNGRGDDDQNGRDRRKGMEIFDGERSGKAKKKLKRKCRLEHGVLTKEQISMLIGLLIRREDCTIPDTLSEFLKCVEVCFESRSNADSHCESCLAVQMLFTHSIKCSAEKCQRCDVVLTLYFAQSPNPSIGSNRAADWPNALWSQEDARQDGMRQIRDDLADWLCPETSSEGTGNDHADGSLSDDMDSHVEEPAVVDESEVPSAELENSEAGAQGLPNVEADQFNPYWPPSKDYPSVTGMQQHRNSSLLTDPRSVRCGSVIYGTKELVASVAMQLNDVAFDQRTNEHSSTLHQFVSSVGVILHYQRGNLMIKDNNYEPDTEWTYLTPALGSGVSGSCFAGYDLQTGFHFCVKRIPIHKFYADEVLIWMDMEHQDIVEFYGIVVYGNFVYILQELITGIPLKEYIRTRSALDAYEALTYLQHLLTLLEYLKRKGVIHNDIKADNLLLREPETSTRLVLIDFGLANQTSYVSSGVSPTGGQTQWSPEKAASEGYGFPADVWAAIAVFVHMLSGNEPWSVRFRNAGFLHYIIKHHSPPLEDIPEFIPCMVRDLIVGGWTVDPDARPTASQLLKHEAFKLLDLCEPTADIFSLHLLSIGSQDAEPENAEETQTPGSSLLEEAITEELISLAQQQLSIERCLSSTQQPGSTVPVPALELTSEVNNALSERPTFKEIKGSSLRILANNLNSISKAMFDPEALDPALSLVHGNGPAKADKGEMKIEDSSYRYLLKNYNDLSITGRCLFRMNPPEMPDILEVTAMSDPDLLQAEPPRQSVTLHRVKLLAARPGDDVAYPVAETAVIPLMVEEFVLSSDEESEDKGAVALRSRDGDKDYPDESQKFLCMPLTMDEPPISMGTTIRMFHVSVQVYCIHLHPGTESSWSEIFKRASTQIHERGVLTFTAEICDGDQAEAIDISSVIPSRHELRVTIVPLCPFQDHGWMWKVEDSRLIYHATYLGNFGPDFY